MAKPLFAKVGIDSPVRKVFDYRVPENMQSLRIGTRVRVQFGKRNVIGVVLELSKSSEITPERLKNIQAMIDQDPVFDRHSLKLIEWAAKYYQYPIGPALFNALPPTLRRVSKHSESKHTEFLWSANTNKTSMLSRAPKQAAILRWLYDQATGVTSTKLNQKFPSSYSSITALEQRGLITREPINEEQHFPSNRPEKINLTPEQKQISSALCSALNGFSTHLLEGVTGSGKTEIYFSVIEQILAQPDGQTLILVPEIGLTPQLLTRLQNYFCTPIGLLHSNLSENQRAKTWKKIIQGNLRIVLGTRLAVFTPMPNLKLIIVDEEHDASLKQQEGFLYHARDVAIYRAQKCNIPIILGSATPSFESLHNVELGKYKHHILSKRIHSSAMPKMKLIDMRIEQAGNIISTQLMQAMHKHLKQNGQVILFLNRRGYAPALICHDCGWVAQCKRCDANSTYHARAAKLICHHCDYSQPKPQQCPTCSANNLIAIGHGTQRIEEILKQQFPAYSHVRLDRDAARRKGSLEKILTDIREQNHQIIIGTQMLSKGHDFPNISLVGILDVDYGIFSADFRALERTAQLLIQVAGRSGRRQKRGEVYVQTHAPDHPLLNELLNFGYPTFAEHALQLRSDLNLPPYSHQINLRATSQQLQHVNSFLQSAGEMAKDLLSARINIFGPISPGMEKKAGRYRAYLLLSTKHRGAFGNNLRPWLEQLENMPTARRVRWNVDVDPIENI